MPMERTERERDAKEVRAAAERTEPDASGEAVPNVAVRQEVTLLTAQEEMRSSSARAVSDEIERDARRYDSGFYLY